MTSASFAFGTLRFVLIGWGADQVWLMVLAQLMHAATFGAYHAAALGMVNTWFPDSMRSRGQALYMSLSFGAGGMIGGIGSVNVQPLASTTYTLTASSAFGTNSATVEVQVVQICFVRLDE